MRSWRQCLNDESYKIVDDLTKIDLEEKKRWTQEVSELYKNGVKLRFVGGLWRDRHGKKAPFYKESPEPVVKGPPEDLNVK